MAAFIIHRDFGAQENKVCYCFHFSLFSFYEVMRLDAMILVFSSLTQQKKVFLVQVTANFC